MESYTAAGIFFTEKGQFLSGFQRKTRQWTGFGGKKKNSENSLETAVRETVEELFEISLRQNEIQELIFHLLLSQATPTTTQRGSYIFYTMKFDAIFTIIDFLFQNGMKTALYHPNYPSTMKGLIDDRWSSTKDEMEKIGLYRFSEIQELKNMFDPHFLADLTFP
jgi:hypothetical protein